MILIVASNPELSGVWARHLERHGHVVVQSFSQAEAVANLQWHEVDTLVLDLMLQDGSALAVADYASYRRPSARVVFVTNSTFFSDGSIFNHTQNTVAFLHDTTPPNDLAAIVDYHGRA